MAHLNLIGKQFGKLFVIEKLDVRNGCRFWLCKCDCGNTSEVSSSNLSGGVRQCKICGHRVPKPGLRKRPYEALFNKLVYECTNPTRRVHTPITLTYEEFVEIIQRGFCIYCGLKMTWTDYFYGESQRKIEFSEAYRLDRKDNSQGYTRENCVVCCISCNKTKSNRFTFEEFTVMMNALKEFRALRVTDVRS